jgi:hypothetical protein
MPNVLMQLILAQACEIPVAILLLLLMIIDRLLIVTTSVTGWHTLTRFSLAAATAQ